MAKSFYSQEEARQKLGMTENQLKDLVRNGQLREFRDAGKINYKVGEVDKLAAEFADGGDDDSGDSGSGDSSSGDPGLGGSSGGSLSGSLSQFDMLSTGELTLEDTGASGAGESQKSGAPSKSKTDLSALSGLGEELSLSADESLGGGSFADSMKTGDLVLEPVGGEEDSGINLTEGGLTKDGTADAVSLDDTVTDKSEDDEKEGTVVSSIGVSVFDDDDVEQDADPLAQTVVAGGSDALGIDSTGSGSGLLDLTRESDDTSLGAELLDEIYPADEEESSAEMGEETKAGLADALPDSDSGGTDFAEVESAAAAPAAPAAVARTRVEYAPDALATGFSWMLGASVLVMCLAGVTCAAAVRGVWPNALQTLADNMLIVGGVSLGATVLALGIGFMLGRKAEK